MLAKIGSMSNSNLNYKVKLLTLLVHSKKNEQLAAILLRTGLNNVLLPILLTVVNNNVQHFYILNSGSTILFRIADNCQHTCVTNSQQVLPNVVMSSPTS